MKNLLFLIFCLLFSGPSFSQIVTDVDAIYSFYGELSAVRKSGTWGFINKEGVLKINYRSDIVLNNDSNEKYPIFKNGRCLVKRLIDNIYMYGFIDEKGNDVVTPQYLNASNFENGYAIVVKLLKDTIGYNEVFRKPLTKYKLEEYIIDVSGKTIKYLENPIEYIIPKRTQLTPPKIHSKFIAPGIVAVQNKNKKWNIYKY